MNKNQVILPFWKKGKHSFPFLAMGIPFLFIWFFLAEGLTNFKPLSTKGNNAVTIPTRNYRLSAPSGWQYRRQLTFDNSAQSENLANFPVLVILDNSRINYTNTQNNGEDLRFYDADDVTPLAYEIEEWNESGLSYVWVSVPQINGSSNTDYIWMYYGNGAAADGQDVANTWNSGYQGVWHLNETSGTHYDATSNGNDGTPENGVIQNTAGRIGGANDFDGSNDDVLIADDPSLDISAQVTISAWIEPDNSNSYARIADKSHTSDGQPYSMYGFYMSSNQRLMVQMANGATDVAHEGATTIPLNQWTYIAGTYDGSTQKSFFDGALDGSTNQSFTINTNNVPFTIGKASYGNSSFFDGKIDEIRVSNVARSEDWIAAQYASMTDAFISFGVQEVLIDTDGDLISDINDLDDDNDGIPDSNEGCGNTTNISGTIGIGNNVTNTNYSLVGTTITYSRSGANEATLSGYNAGTQGASIRFTANPSADGTLISTFSNPVSSVYFKLTDFDEWEDYTVNVYDENSVLYDLTAGGVLSLGTTILQTGNQFVCQTSETYAGGPVVDGNDPADDPVGSLIFFFPGKVSAIHITYSHSVSSSIRFIQPTFCSIDTDSDGIFNYLDLDSDNDGILDVDEAGHSAADADDDGVIDGLASVFGTNGLFDALETFADSDIINYTISDSEEHSKDGIYDPYELDADGDGCNDTDEENISDTDSDGIAGVGIPTVDVNGLVTAIIYAAPANNIWQNPLMGPCVTEICYDAIDNDLDGLIDCADPDCSANDNDGDLICNGLDLDDDNDGIPDVDESVCDTTITYAALWHHNAAPVDMGYNYVSSWISSVDDMVYGAGLGAAVVVDRVEMSGLDQEYLLGAIVDNDYLEYGFTTQAGINTFYLRTLLATKHGATSSVIPDNYGYDIAVLITDDNFLSYTTLEYSYTFNTTIDPTYSTVNYGLDDNFYILSPSTNYKFRVYFYNKTTSSAVNAWYDDFGFQISTCALTEDTDNDAVLNYLDLDSDNDGIFDVDEAGHSATDADDDGIIDGLAAAFGTNGLFDALETSADSDTINYLISDSEAVPDNTYDAYELDSDADGCNDTDEENIADSDSDGIAGTGVPTVDINGLVTAITYAPPPNTYWQDFGIDGCVEICNDTIDNDGDGQTDCADSECCCALAPTLNKQ